MVLPAPADSHHKATKNTKDSQGIAKLWIGIQIEKALCAFFVSFVPLWFIIVIVK
jgi:hypothetical protein